MICGCAATLILAFSPVVVPPINLHLVGQGSFTSYTSNEQHVLVLYYTTYCPYSQKVLKYLKKIDKEVTMKNLEANPEAKAELKRIGGKMQVPCLVIDGRAMYESDTIIEWLNQHQHELSPTQTLSEK